MNLLSRFGPLLGLLAVYSIFAILGPDSFTSGRNLETIARQTAIVGTAALGMTIIRSGCSQMGLPNWVQEIVTGIIIVIAVALDRYRHRSGD